jgi:tRNA-dihydrouridine synthase B
LYHLTRDPSPTAQDDIFSIMNNFWSSFAPSSAKALEGKKATDDKTKLNSSARGGQAFYVLAPMAGITDSAFRQICKEFGADVVYSEMASTAALVYNPKPTLEMLKFAKAEKPYVVQLFGSNPEHFAQAVKLVTKKIKPDGIDINFGCPVKKVAKQGAGAVLMNNLKLAHEIVKVTIANTNLPVSIKCRSQVGDVSVLKFLDSVKDLDIKAAMIHGRTLKQGHSGPVDFKIIKEARRHFNGVIIANGGVKDFTTAQELLERTGVDGMAIGQGALGKPWIFKEFSISNFQFSITDIKQTALKHTKLVYKLKGEQGVVEMRKHLCWYVGGLPGAKELRRELVGVKTIIDIERIFNDQ